MTKIPWHIWLSVLGVTSAMIGVHWDISWHRSIGRDTFWTPAHIAIQLCGVIAGITCGYLILWTTFAHSRLRAASVNVLGFRGPLGALCRRARKNAAPAACPCRFYPEIMPVLLLLANVAISRVVVGMHFLSDVLLGSGAFRLAV